MPKLTSYRNPFSGQSGDVTNVGQDLETAKGIAVVLGLGALVMWAYNKAKQAAPRINLSGILGGGGAAPKTAQTGQGAQASNGGGWVVHS